KSSLLRGDGTRVVVVVMTDITDRQRAEAALRTSEERFRQLTELSNDWYWEQDEELRFTLLAGGSKGGLQRELAGGIGKTRWELPITNMTQQQWDAHKRLLAQRSAFYDLELAYRMVDGSTMYMSLSGSPYYDADGKFLGYRGTTRDITAREVSERHITRLKDLYTALSEVNNAIIHSQDREHLFAQVCKAVVEHGHLQFVRVALLDPATEMVRTVAHSRDDHGLSAR